MLGTSTETKVRINRQGMTERSLTAIGIKPRQGAPGGVANKLRNNLWKPVFSLGVQEHASEGL